METKSKQTTVRVSEHTEPAIEKLFVYGIFLDEMNREFYGMEYPSYDTVQGFITVGNHIVRAIPSSMMNACLTGLLVDVPTRQLASLDALEAGYDRIKVKTTGGFDAFMYAAPGSGDNYSTYRSMLYEQDDEEEQESFAL